MTNSDKEQLFKDVEKKLKDQGFEIDDHDFGRPWGGFFVINEDQAQKFIDTYFDDEVEMSDVNISGKLSPKILLVEPGKRLSWQYHHRRAEMWQVVEGPVGVVRSKTDEQNEVKTYKAGDLITLEKGERHRLVGLKNWGIIAEIWQHTDPKNPSDEEDIVRLEDDFGR
ncbi:MAG: phosphoheptose isomerase [Balneola sp.]|jgi:mannose-6-phosphate isomerase-like protein (cupin superfamily)|nr:phosphoheptose isomerase [Balneola sp.]MBE80519.1 phosphoheptose isomerase [Balneola sp.]HBX66385.1 phosphoheptose isomerase [Balneolaceae bacterium]|tara:strand:- start:837 stop:1340 length:504 start_codon:yes stop_codon:yes gene_type:complete